MRLKNENAMELHISPPPLGEGRVGASRWLALYILCTGFLMIVLDQTIVNVALPSIKNDLGFSQAGLAWVVNAYLIAFGGFLLLAGRLGDLLGRKRIFLAGLGMFTAASLICGLSISPDRQPANQGGGGEHAEAGEEDPLPAEQVTEPAGEQQETAKGDQVGIDDPGKAGLGEAEIVLDRGEGDVDDRLIEHDHQKASAQDDERQPARGPNPALFRGRGNMNLLHAVLVLQSHFASPLFRVMNP